MLNDSNLQMYSNASNMIQKAQNSFESLEYHLDYIGIIFHCSTKWVFGKYEKKALGGFSQHSERVQL